MQNVNASIITIGDELLIGQTVDTNSAFIAQELNKIGIWVRRRVAVGDLKEEIRSALDEERKYASVIIMTGGLGPTADDITKPLLCEYFGAGLVVNEQVLEHVKHLFEKIFRRPGPILESNLKQAEVPDNCIVLHNKRGTAPGMWWGAGREAIFISLPGVPHEMKGLMIDEVIPRLKESLILPAIVHKTAFTAGQGESFIADQLKDFESALPAHIKLAYLPNYGLVKLRLTATGIDSQELEKEMSPWFIKMQGIIKDWLVSDQDEGLENVIGKLLRSSGKTLSTAESCTGGYIAHLITSVAGSSDYYKGTVVCYSNEIKENILGVSPATIAAAGAVSEETVKQMASGAVKKLKSHFALATSGIMGPGGGSTEKPVGTVWIAVSNGEKTEAKQFNFRFDRQRNIIMTALTALNFLRKFILEET